MVSYQVHMHVRHEIYDACVRWMRENHIPDMLSLEGFNKAELLFRKGGSMESSGKEIKIVYTLTDEETLKKYLAGPAMKMREKTLDKFPGQFSVQREVWLDVEAF